MIMASTGHTGTHSPHPSHFLRSMHERKISFLLSIVIQVINIIIVRHKMNYIQITIDGPAGSGKSTVANVLSKKLGFLYVNSGLVYRIITYSLLNQKQDLNQITISEFNKLAHDLHDLITTKYNAVLTARMLTPSYLLSEEVAVNTSKIAKLPFVREFANQIFFDIANQYNIIIDGRDMGSVVFKNAFLKFYLEASIPTRANRRYQQLLDKQQDADLAKITLEITNRDETDKKRSIAPLVIPHNAIVINTDDLSIDDVATFMYHQYLKKLKNH